tara:strand:- start:256 stop:1176 length:921 start_codon:yes stop_codon:yes gene_type:complete
MNQNIEICKQNIQTGPNRGLVCGRKLNFDGICQYHKKKIDINKSYNIVENNCPICLEQVSLYDYKNKSGIHILDCGHKLHGVCYQQLLFKSENGFKCPLCRKNQSSCDIGKQIKNLHTEIRNLNSTLSNVQETLMRTEEDCIFWEHRYRKWKNKCQNLFMTHDLLLRQYTEVRTLLIRYSNSRRNEGHYLKRVYELLMRYFSFQNSPLSEEQMELVNQIQQLIVYQQRLQGIEQNNDIPPTINSLGNPNNIIPPTTRNLLSEFEINSLGDPNNIIPPVIHSMRRQQFANLLPPRILPNIHVNMREN